VTVAGPKVIEAILLLADEPVPARQMSEVLELPVTAVEEMLRDIQADYESSGRGFGLREVAGGWRLFTSPDCAPWLERFVVRHSHGRLTAAALEVLAILAYRGPLSRSQVAEIRGIDSDGVVKTLIRRGYVEEMGRAPGPGSPVMLGLTGEFVEKIGLRSLEELPPLRGFMPDAEAVEAMEAGLSPGA
jgi:segregation and condensation protein B